MMQLPKLQRERALDSVYNALRQAIVGCQIKPGTRLNIEELAAQLGVSLTPVRGAVQRLATEGLVDIRARSGTYVASLSLQDIEETFEIRGALECLAAERAAARLTAQDARRLRELLRLLKKPMRTQEERETHERLNGEFHRLIIQAAGNRRLVEMYDALNAHIRIARIHAADASWSARQRQESSEHEAILAALESGDAPGAVQTLRAHILRARDTLLGALRSRLDAPPPDATPQRSAP